MKKSVSSKMSPYTALLFFYSLAIVSIWLEYLSLKQPLLSILALGVFISPALLILKHEVDLKFDNIAYASRYFLAFIPLAAIFAFFSFFFASYERYISSFLAMLIAVTMLPTLFKLISPRPFRYAIKRQAVKASLSKKVKEKNAELAKKIDEEKKKFYDALQKQKDELEEEIRVKRKVESMRMRFEQEKLKIKLAKIEQQMIDTYKIDAAVANLIENELENINASNLPQEQKEQLVAKVQKDFEL